MDLSEPSSYRQAICLTDHPSVISIIFGIHKQFFSVFTIKHSGIVLYCQLLGCTYLGWIDLCCLPPFDFLCRQLWNLTKGSISWPWLSTAQCELVKGWPDNPWRLNPVD